MKKHFWLLPLLILCTFFNLKAKRAVILIEIEKPTSNSVEMQYYSSPLNIILNNYTVIKNELNQSNQHKFVVDISEPINFNLINGKSWLLTNKFLAPDDSIIFNFSEGSVSFEGDCERCVGFQFEWEAKFLANSAVRSQSKIALQDSSHLGYLKFKQQNLAQQLSFYNEYFKDTAAPKNFETFFLNDIKYSYLVDLLQFSWKSKKGASAMSDPNYLKEITGTPPLNNTSSLNQKRYLFFLRELPYTFWDIRYSSSDSAEKKHLLKNRYSFRDSIAKVYFSGEVYEYALSKILIEVINSSERVKGSSRFNSAYEKADSLLFIHRNSFKNKPLYTALQEKLISLKSTIKAPDFEVSTLDNKPAKLSDFMGKVIYIDFWATNCSPCIKEMPYTKKLISHFEDNDDVEVVLVSFDRNRDILDNFITKNDFKGNHLIAKDGFASAVAHLYNVNALPRYIIIDKNGYLVTKNAPRPSQNPIDLLIGLSD